jgi:hypothetical protein
MKELIRSVLREYVEEYIQEVNFDGFSEPILIPQFNKYIVKFNGTGKVEKMSDSEKIIFKDKGGKEYTFDSNDVQKSGGSPFYINLDVLRRNYDIRFKDNFVRHKEELNQKQSQNLLNDKIKDYISEGRCKTKKCEDLRNVIESSLMELYSNDYGPYVSTSCEPTQGFLNVYPIEGTFDKNRNLWSKLNYLIYKKETAYIILLTYIKKYGTFEHGDFIEWVNEDKERLFKGPFLSLIFKNIDFPKVKTSFAKDIMVHIKNVFPDAKLVDSFCPTTRKDYTETITIISQGKKIVFQIVFPKHKVVLNIGEKYYLSFGKKIKQKSPNINRNADYIITNDGTIYENSNVVSGQRVFEFDKPPIYSIHPTVVKSPEEKGFK